jgi:hypothetical protein
MPEPDISSQDRSRIGKYLQLDEDQLYSVLATYTDKNSVFDPAGQRAAGKRAFARLEATLHARLCDEWGLCARLKEESVKDATNVVVIIGDVIAAHVVGLPPFLIASLLVKIGLRQFCKC